MPKSKRKQYISSLEDKKYSVDDAIEFHTSITKVTV